MSDATRFRVFANMAAHRWPNRSARIADVAGGKGYLNAALYRLGYRNVVTFDKRPDRWTRRPHYHYGLFDGDVTGPFDLLLGMHPDAATDEIIAHAARYRCPFAIVPCCILPAAFPYTGPRDHLSWIAHLVDLAEGADFAVSRSVLAIRGANTLLCGEPRGLLAASGGPST